MEGVGWVEAIGNVAFIRHTMLVPIPQLRLHVIISKVISDRGSTEGPDMSFHPQVVIQVLAKLYKQG